MDGAGILVAEFLVIAGRGLADGQVTRGVVYPVIVVTLVRAVIPVVGFPGTAVGRVTRGLVVILVTPEVGPLVTADRELVVGVVTPDLALADGPVIPAAEFPDIVAVVSAATVDQEFPDGVDTQGVEHPVGPVIADLVSAAIPDRESVVGVAILEAEFRDTVGRGCLATQVILDLV